MNHLVETVLFAIIFPVVGFVVGWKLKELCSKQITKTVKETIKVKPTWTHTQRKRNAVMKLQNEIANSECLRLKHIDKETLSVELELVYDPKK